MRKREYPTILRTLLVAGPLLGLGCGALPGLEPGPPNLLLVTVSALRADQLGPERVPAIATPNLDRLVAGGVHFSRANASAPLTLPSLASLFTGRHPFSHGVRDDETHWLPETELSLPEILKQAGYQTAAVVGAALLNRRFGLVQGFDSYDEVTVPVSAQVEDLRRDSSDVTGRALAWLREERSGATPFFLWVAYSDADAAVSIDPEIGSLLGGLDELGLSESTLLVFTAEHGGSLGKQGAGTNGFVLYQRTLEVPLVLRKPGVLPAGRVVARPVRSIDVLPTVLALLDLESRSDVHGQSLLPDIRGVAPEGEIEIYAETLAGQLRFGHSPIHALRRGDWKYVLDTSPELYDLKEDPSELHDRYRDFPERARALHERLSELLPGAAPKPSGRDPRQTVQVVRAIETAHERLRRRRYGQAIFFLQGALAFDPRNDFLAGELARAHERRGRLEEAVRVLEEFPEPLQHPTAALHQGRILLRAGRLDEATQVLARLVERAPRQPQAHYYLAQAHLEQGRRDRAFQSLRRAVELEPKMPEAHAALAGLHREDQRIDPAIASYRTALELDPGESASALALAELLLQRDSCRGALDAYRRAVELDPWSVAARESLARCLLRLGEVDEAAEHAMPLRRIGGDGALALAVVGARLAREERLQGATQVLEESRERDPDSPDVWYYLAVVQAMRGESQQALTSLARCLELGGPYRDRLREDKAFRSLRRDERFVDLLSRFDS